MWTSATRDIIEMWKRNNIYKQVPNPSHETAQRLCSKQAGVRGRLESSRWGRAVEGRCGVRGGRKREPSLHRPSLGSFLSVYHALEKEGVNVKVTPNPWNISLLWSFKKEKKKKTYNLLISHSIQCLLGQCFQASFEVFGSSFAIYVSSSPLRLCSFLLFLFIPLWYHLQNKKEITLWQVFHPFHEVLLVGKFTALSLFTSLGHHWGTAVVLSRLQETAADQSRSQVFFFFF